MKFNFVKVPNFVKAFLLNVSEAKQSQKPQFLICHSEGISTALLRFFQNDKFLIYIWTNEEPTGKGLSENRN